MKKTNKIILIIFAVVILISGIICTLISDDSAFSVLDTPKNEMFALYIEDDDGEYVLSKDKKFPTDGYVLNIQKSQCQNGGVLSQDETTKAINLSTPQADKCVLYFEKEKVPPDELIVKVKKSTIVVDRDSDASGWEQIINDNVYAEDTNGEKYDTSISYTTDKEIVGGKVASYSVTYKVDDESISSNQVTTKFIVSIPPSIDFTTMNYTVYNTTVNSSTNGITRVSSSGEDPQMIIPFEETNYYSPNLYRYVVIRYRSTSSQNNLMGIYMTSTPTDQKYFIYANNIKTDGTWVELVLDLWSNDNIKSLDYISGVRFDFTNNANVTMDLDYIKFVKTLDVDYIYLENFDTNSYTNYNYTNLNVVSCTNSVLSVTSTNSDPQIKMVLNESQYFDPLRYKFLYVRYKFTGATDYLEMFMVPNPTDQTYSLGVNITGNGQWNTVVVDLSANPSVLALGKITGWRLDPIKTANLNIQIDYIGVSDRVRYNS